ncbi:MAG: hypothetical protein HC882_07735 [Acidobacteria bacterium]|nr:hypothetical protein [Acidobacteriota bacterium]
MASDTGGVLAVWDEVAVVEGESGDYVHAGATFAQYLDASLKPVGSATDLPIADDESIVGLLATETGAPVVILKDPFRSDRTVVTGRRVDIAVPESTKFLGVARRACDVPRRESPTSSFYFVSAIATYEKGLGDECEVEFEIE